ncbi:MAG: hypothetical protein MK134_12050, partial [Dehalococcoidia bacterium]|nr:hypothetical protein [Dehalococcoidia bacterium]
TSLYAFYARAALAHPKDWAERLMNDPNTQWPEVRSTRNLARLWLFLGSGFVLLLFAAVLVAQRRRLVAATA